jgi:hypothetical protein
MGKKFVVRLTEQELADLIAKKMLGSDDFIGDVIKGLQKPSTKTTPTTSTSTSSNIIPSVGSSAGSFPELDLNSPDGFNAYKEICDKFIGSRSSNLLGINGTMMANAAKSAFSKYGKYVPAELALAQLATEGGFSNNPKARPIRTKNPFNVGNYDNGKNIFHSTVQSGIQAYYDLIARDYLTNGKTASDLLNNFVNKNGLRYATGKYEDTVSSIANKAKQMSQPIYASLTKKTGSNIA